MKKKKLVRLCTQHDPVRVQAEEQKREAERREREAERRAQWQREAEAQKQARDRQQRMEAFVANAAAKTREHNEHKACDCDLCTLWRAFVRA